MSFDDYLPDLPILPSELSDGQEDAEFVAELMHAYGMECIRSFWQPHTMSNVDRMNIPDMHRDADNLVRVKQETPKALTDGQITDLWWRLNKTTGVVGFARALGIPSPDGGAA